MKLGKCLLRLNFNACEFLIVLKSSSGRLPSCFSGKTPGNIFGRIGPSELNSVAYHLGAAILWVR